eukprot:gene5692-6881_t
MNIAIASSKEEGRRAGEAGMFDVTKQGKNELKAAVAKVKAEHQTDLMAAINIAREDERAAAELRLVEVLRKVESEKKAEIERHKKEVRESEQKVCKAAKLDVIESVRQEERVKFASEINKVREEAQKKIRSREEEIRRLEHTASEASIAVAEATARKREQQLEERIRAECKQRTLQHVEKAVMEISLEAEKKLQAEREDARISNQLAVDTAVTAIREKESVVREEAVKAARAEERFYLEQAFEEDRRLEKARAHAELEHVRQQATSAQQELEAARERLSTEASMAEAMWNVTAIEATVATIREEEQAHAQELLLALKQQEHLAREKAVKVARQEEKELAAQAVALVKADRQKSVEEAVKVAVEEEREAATDAINKAIQKGREERDEMVAAAGALTRRASTSAGEDIEVDEANPLAQLKLLETQEKVAMQAAVQAAEQWKALHKSVQKLCTNHFFGISGQLVLTTFALLS